jgi:hypothetical protein
VVNDSGRGEQGIWGDFNNDGKVDLFVANIFDRNNFLYRNDGDGVFTKIGSGPQSNDGGHSIGAAWGDYDNDGFLDLCVANASFSGDVRNFLYRNTGTGTFTKVTSGRIATDTALSLSCAWGDYDNDGFLDLFVTSLGSTNALYRNQRDGTFSRVTIGSIATDVGEGSGAWADYDNDGFLDVFVANGSANVNFLYHNDANSNQWLKIKCVGGPSNRAAIGAKIRVLAQTDSTGPSWQMREISGGSGYGSQNSLIVHFGLGQATKAQNVRIEWPSGLVQRLTNVTAKQMLTVSEPPLIQAQLTNEQFELLLTDNIGFASHIEASANLQSWTSVGVFSNTTRTIKVPDVTTANDAHRFYRAAPR